MIKNFLKVAWRNLIKHPVYSGINVLGLSIGIGTALLMILFARHEWSFDTFHSQKDSIYRVWVKEFVEGHTHFNTVTPIVVGDALEESFPEVERLTRIVSGNYLIRSRTEASSQENVFFADPQFLRVFDFKMLFGHPSLESPTEIIVTKAEAIRHFGRVDVVGEELEVNINGEWKSRSIVGVLADVPPNSSLQFSYVVPYAVFDAGLSENARACWTCVFGETYVLLDEHASMDVLQSMVTTYFDKAVEDIYPAGDYQIGFQPLEEVHLSNDYPQGIASVSDGRYPVIMLGIALLILLLAGINYVNLAVARSMTRHREVGIRKVVGAGQGQIVFQHCSEAILLTAVATAFGISIAYFLLPQFNMLFGQSLQLSMTPSLLLGLGIATVIIGGAASLYPAAILSRFKPLDVLSEQMGTSRGSRQIVLRLLVGFQFFLSVGLLVAALVVKQQAAYLSDRNLGFDKTATMIVPFASTGSFSEDMAAADGIAQRLRNELRGSSIDAVTCSNHVFGSQGWMRLGFMDDGSNSFRSFRLNGVDADFVSSYQLQLVEGSDFQADQSDVDQTVLVNEAFVREYGLEGAVGSVLPGPFSAFRIRGVLRDFHFASLHQEIEPLVLASDPLAIARVSPDLVTSDSPTPKLSIKIPGDAVPAGVQSVRMFWRDHAVDMPFDFSFLEEDINRVYQAEMRLKGIVSAGTILAIVIAALGICGLCGIALNRRRQELGVRMILGASKHQLTTLLFREFTLVFIVAILLAMPLTSALLQSWLEEFAYHTEIGISTYVLAALSLLAVCLIAIMAQSLKIFRLDPVHSIREE
ncbi:MAG: ABC transporter permease [Saprospiraceae bacterium]|nr:ABC transporter permease [Saprospiraceae bacterium]